MKRVLPNTQRFRRKCAAEFERVAAHRGSDPGRDSPDGEPYTDAAGRTYVRMDGVVRRVKGKTK